METTTTAKTDREIWDEIRENFRAAAALAKENKESMKETDRQMKETDRMIKETRESIKETDRQMQETRKEIERMSREIADLNKRYGGLSNELGKMVEDLCKPAALKLFRKAGIKVDHLYEGPRHLRKDEEEMEIDVLFCNTTEMVAVEAKTTCYKKDIDHFLQQMKKFKTLFNLFASQKVYVAIAAMRFANGADIYARRKGLFVISPTGDGLFTLESPAKRTEF